MPVARGPQMNARSAVLVGFTGVAIAIVLGGGVLFLASQGGDVEIQLGDTAMVVALPNSSGWSHPTLADTTGKDSQQPSAEMRH